MMRYTFLLGLGVVCLMPGGVLSGTDQLDTIFLRLFVGDTPDDYVDHNLRDASLLVKKLDSNKPTVCYIHGYTESADSDSVKVVMQGYMYRKDHNMLAVDYREIAKELYPKVAWDAESVGEALANALNEMVKAGLDAEKLHVVAHSLGAQVAGYMGRKVDFQIPRITGLDPAGPLFNVLEDHLETSDAGFVDIIHTDWGVYGIARASGTADFCPNGGHRIQPGCPPLPIFFTNDDFCSHHRSWRFYAESLYTEDAFYAVECQSQLQFMRGDCDNNRVIPMGYATPKDAKGTYFLRTGSESPFGLKQEGAKGQT